jgi:FtsP/CotA-like multicopper oxidase with cupredoxin domain
MIEVEVENKLPDEGTSIHWHGLLQKDSPWMDGVPSVSQCPIAPSKSFTYRFKADQFGSSWYHSHYSAQYAGGALGAMIIHGPKIADYDVDIGPIILSDWYHSSYEELVQGTMFSTTGRPPLSQNNLINGKMNYPCANTTQPCIPNAGISKFSFKPGKKYRLRLINTSADGMQKFSIDGHTFTVVAQDFVAIKPYTTDLITLAVGQRADVIVEAVGKAKEAYWMRSQLGAGPASCSLADGASPNGMAAVLYEGAEENVVPTTTSTISVDRINTCANDGLDKTEPLFTIPAAPVGVLATQELHFDITNNGTAFVWIVNNQTFRGDMSESILLDAKAGTLNAKPAW